MRNIPHITDIPQSACICRFFYFVIIKIQILHRNLRFLVSELHRFLVGIGKQENYHTLN